MSSPVGHVIVGLMLYTVARRLNVRQQKPGWVVLILLLVLTVLPDLDILLIWYLKFPEYETHRTFSHSIVFAMGTGLLAYGLFRLCSRRGIRHMWWLFPLAVLTHPLIDMLCVSNAVGARGVELFWPFSQVHIYTPVSFMRTVGTFLIPHNPLREALLHAAWWEIRLFGSLYLMLLAVDRLIVYLWDLDRDALTGKE
jgi:membrane-bound metal-dependent hydrolase YbcI (DUF457 family)